MQPRIDLISVLTSDAPALAAFYRDVLGLPVQGNNGDDYVEFATAGVRFAVCARAEMTKATTHPSYAEERRGQAFELAFLCDTPEAVDATCAAIVAKGATPVQAPAAMPWGHHAAFFADPEGNIHELFAVR